MAGKSKAPAQVKAKPPRNLTPALCERLRRDLLAHAKGRGNRKASLWKVAIFSDIDLRHGFDIGFRVGIPTNDILLFTEEAPLEALAGSFGLEPSDYARSFRPEAKAPRVTAINPNRPRYPTAPNASSMAADTSSPPKKTSHCVSELLATDLCN